MRVLFAGIGILSTWMLFDLVLHRLFLAPLYQENPALWRPADELSSPLVVLVTSALIAVLVTTYRLLIRPKSLPAGTLLGAFVGLALGIATGFGTYVHMPIPAALAWAWFGAAWLKGIAAGAIMGFLIFDS